MPLTRRTFTVSALCLTAAPVWAQTGPRWYDNGSGFAASGKDVVAYFSLGDPGDRAIAGSQAFQMRHKGATFVFANAGNMAAFKAAPDRYAPRYGGHCAFAMASGSFAPTDPDAWTVYGGALYLNASQAVRRAWSADIAGFVAKSDAVWASAYPGER